MICKDTVNGYVITTDYYPLDHQWETAVHKVDEIGFAHTDIEYPVCEGFTKEVAAAGHALIVRAYKGEQISADDMPGDVRVFMGKEVT